MDMTYSSRFVRESKVEYILTIPASWSDSAKALMVKAAEDAGFGSLGVDFNLVSEPECAAAYTLKATEPNNMKVRVLYYLSYITVTDLY
jgi:molecular chaperone DnaK (HSP70)